MPDDNDDAVAPRPRFALQHLGLTEAQAAAAVRLLVEHLLQDRESDEFPTRGPVAATMLLLTQGEETSPDLKAAVDKLGEHQDENTEVAIWAYLRGYADRDRHGAEEADGGNVVPFTGDRGWKARAMRAEAQFEEIVQTLRRFRAELIEWVSRELPR